MALRIPQELIDQIRSANDIVDVISERIPTKRAGKNWRALCPFHQEKTPSFNVSPERQIYHCFGCGAGGNVITFLMEYDKLTFPEALRELASRAGIALPSRIEGAEAEDPAYEANRVASLYFRQSLAGEAGKSAREYLKRRGVRDDTAKTFEIGYAPPGWDGLLRAAEREGVGAALLEQAGLVVRREGGGFYDRFRDRVVFPLHVPGGRIVGFGGRALGDQEPKYLNTPETRIYHKGRYLYGLAQTRSAVRAVREAVLVEGYMDLVSLWEAGLANVVASSGTALTAEHAKVLARLADKVFVAYDGDSAGTLAATRAAEALVPLGVKVRVVRLPEGSDPDSFVRASGPAAFRDALAGALDFIDFIVAVRDPRTPEAREGVARTLLETVARTEDPLKADLMLEKIASALSIGRSALSRACDARRADIAVRKPPAEAGKAAARGQGAAAVAAQKGLLAILVAGGDAAALARARCAPGDFTDPGARALAERLFHAEGELDVAGLAAELGADGASLLTEVSMFLDDDVDAARLCEDCVRTLERLKVESEIKFVEDEIRAAELGDDEKRLLAGVARRQELARRLADLAAGGRET